ncbi:MAG: DUF378 domain-containing protein, partial [Chlamydiae bacterium]|nr:DUF378 domain-containing protein [Chlamydiota bacterium]
MKMLNLIASILVVVGALNWGLWGFFQFDLVAFLFGGMYAPISRVVYALVGVAGLWKVKCMISKATCS